jgi:hypothetical protein
MQQHPVPQNITAFEFKLVGFLTLKQFGYLATAGVISFIFFVATASFLKWLFIVPIASFALALAFLPVSGVTFDKWIVLFLRTVANPSKRVWRKEPVQISFLAPQFSRYLRRPANQPTPTTHYGLESYLSQLKAEKKGTRLDTLESTKLAMLDFGEEKEISVIREGPKVAAISKEIITPDSEQKPTPAVPRPLKHEEPAKKPVVDAKTKMGEIKETFSGLAHTDKEGH